MPKLINKIISINNRRTSMRLCNLEWNALNEICELENISRNRLLEAIENDKPSNLGLTYATRLFMVEYYRNASHVNIRGIQTPNITHTLLQLKN